MKNTPHFVWGIFDIALLTIPDQGSLRRCLLLTGR